MEVLDTFTGGKASDASDYLNKAYDIINDVKVPTADDMKFKLQQLVQAGVLTPEQAKTYLQNPNAMTGANIDQTGTNAQQKVIAELLDAAQQGGLDPNEQAQMGQIINQLNTQEKGANDAVLQNQAARGALTGGETMAAQLQNNQGAEANANQLGLGTSANAYNAMLNELTSAGDLGSGLQGQENTQSNTVNAATNAINAFNASQQQNQENYNIGNENAAQNWNLENAQNIGNQNVANENAYAGYQAQLPQEIFGDTMSKAEALAGVNQAQAGLSNEQGRQNAGAIGAITSAIAPAASFMGMGVNPGGGAGAGMSGSGFNSSTMSTGPQGSPVMNESELPGGYDEGGEIHDYLKGGPVSGHAQVPGNSPKNDTVLAKLSPGEIVLPRTVSQNPQPDRVMEFLNRIRKPKSPHPDDVATVLHALGKVREVNPHAI